MVRTRHGGAPSPQSTESTGPMDTSAATAMKPATTAPAAAMARAPFPEKPDTIRTRALVVAAFWAVIIFLGLPMWWKTTSVYRAGLPFGEMSDWADGKACRPVFPLRILVHAPDLQPPEGEHLIRTTQHALDDLNDFSAHHLRLRLIETQSGTDHTAGGRSADAAALNVRLLPMDDGAVPRSQLHQYSERLDIFYPRNLVPSTSTANPPLANYIATELQNLFTEEKATIAYILSNSNTLSPSIQPSITGGGSGANAQSAHQSTPRNNRDQGTALLKSVAPELAESISRRVTRSFKYADTYHLSFSLFTPGPAPSSWDIEPALQEYLIPLLNAFSPISNFSIDTQVQVYAKFSPTAAQPVFDEESKTWTLAKEDLSAFVNAAEWPLSPSMGRGPTINFILYVPSPNQAPLAVRGSGATSWLIPQWGGISILNPNPEDMGTTSSSTSMDTVKVNPGHISKESLKPALSTFSHQLLSLLGTPASPPSLPLRLQTLIRIHSASLLLSSSSTLGSLARLTHSLPSIPIPSTVSTSVSSALSHLSQTCSLLRDGRFEEALASVRVAEKESEGAFFEKSMVGQVYFPDEHKVAVYLPLLGPIMVPLIMAAAKELKRLVAGLRAMRKS